MVELKPCPFCGSDPKRLYIYDGKEYIACMNPDCNVSPVTVAYRAKGAAAREWNKRRGEPGVVRCKDCKHKLDGCATIICCIHDYEIKPNDFCSYGERRDE